MRPARLFALALFLTAAGGCASTSQTPKKLSYTEDARRDYEEAMKAFRAKDWEGARTLFQDVKKNYPQSRYARLSELRVADIDFAQEKFTDAISAYRAFAQTYRTDREAEYARYRLSKALYFDISDTILQPPAEERDQAVTLDAHRELKAFLRAYPKTRWRKDVEYMLEVVTGRLVRHELYVARYYRRRDNFDASIARIDYALKTFPNSGLDPEALVLKGETLLMMNRRKEAKSVFELVIKDWGGPFAITAKSFLDEMKEPSQATPQIRRPADPGIPPKKEESKKTPAAQAPPSEAEPPAAPAR
ncbi:MAG: tetratricopeptide repeat protein [Polyangiaceae bacterium]|nr:tetratricopeptide repeat protein [Polyangiaceae bacterium]